MTDQHNKIPGEFLKRIPMMKPAWLDTINKMREHPHAPRWNTICGDRIRKEDLPFIRKFDRKLRNSREEGGLSPGRGITGWINEMIKSSTWFKEAVGKLDVRKDFYEIRTMIRENLQKNLEQIVPEDADLNRLIVNPTSGTTGHPIPCPNHPKAIGCYDMMVKFVMERHGVNMELDHRRIGAILICAQKQTITYNTVHSLFKGAGFAKINLSISQWNHKESPEVYIREMEPHILSGDPYSFNESIKSGIDYRPAGIITTAATLEKNARKRIEKHFKCPVINIYSLNETGPVAYSCPHDPERMHILPTDIFVEVLTDDGMPAGEGKMGEIAVTGGRNPYMPLLRYRTGDYGKISFASCSCGDPAPYISRLIGRKPVVFRSPAGETVNPVDISRILKDYPVSIHQFIQKKDHSCILNLSLYAPLQEWDRKSMKEQLFDLFGGRFKLTIKENLKLDNGKIIPYIRE